MAPRHYLDVQSTEVAEEDFTDVRSRFLAIREQNRVPSFDVSDADDHRAHILGFSQERTSSRPEQAISQPLQVKDQRESKNALIKAQNTHKCEKCWCSQSLLVGHSLLIWGFSTWVAYIMIGEMKMVHRDADILRRDAFIEYRQSISSDNGNTTLLSNSTSLTWRAKAKAHRLAPLRPLDYEKFTIRINTWKRNEQLIVSLNHHSRCEGVAQIQVIWCDPEEEPPDEVVNHKSGKVVVERHDIDSLNERFHMLIHPPTLGVLNLDDDVLRPCEALDAGKSF